VWPEGLGKLRQNPPHRDANPLTFGLQHTVLTTTLPRAPLTGLVIKKESPVKTEIKNNITYTGPTACKVLSGQQVLKVPISHATFLRIINF
jgi:hypothetical protein